MTTKKSAVLKTPADPVTGNRTDIHLINTTDEVLLPDSTKSLTEKMVEFEVEISKNKPNHAGIWIQAD